MNVNTKGGEVLKRCLSYRRRRLLLQHHQFQDVFIFKVRPLPSSLELSINSACRTLSTPLTAQEASLQFPQAKPRQKHVPCILEGISAVGQRTDPRRPAGGKSVTVFGIDLSEYLLATSNDSPLERFLKEENRLGEMASSPWVARKNKL
jgi:hypothetical protein